jgi:hypothetical protein
MIVNSLDGYSYRIIGKLTAFLQLQEFSLRNLPVDSSTSAVRRSLHILKKKSGAPSPRLHLYVLTLILTGCLLLQESVCEECSIRFDLGSYCRCRYGRFLNFSF